MRFVLVIEQNNGSDLLYILFPGHEVLFVGESGLARLQTMFQ